MKVSEPGEERPISWTAIRADTPVFAADGEEVGTVYEVLGSQGEDIFHGIVIRAPAIGHEVEIAAKHVTTITTHRLGTSLTSQEIRALPVYVEEASYKLGFVGFLRKRLGWTSDQGDGPA